MSEVVKVVHTEIVHRRPVRFVLSPLAGMDVPWVVVGDALRMAGATDHTMQQLLQSLSEHVGGWRTVGIDDAVETVAPFWVLIELLNGIGAPIRSPGTVMVNVIKGAYPQLSAMQRMQMAFGSPSLMAGAWA